MHRSIPRIVILGNGLLGSEIHKQTGWDIISRKENGFDITQPDMFMPYFIDLFDGVAVSKKYDVIVNCIANTNTYSTDKEKHWNVNYKGVVDLVDFCNKWDIKLVHISTDYVYTNSINEVSENDIPIHGNNWYSYTKLLGDAYIELKLNDYLICRGTHKPKPFPYEKAWIDQTGNFDYVDVISGLIVQLIQSDSIGMFNIGTNIKSIFELASQTTPVKVAFRPSEVPGNTTMNVNKLNNAFKGINK
jgi:dTDP-4-dehydrorhamnose reductase